MGLFIWVSSFILVATLLSKCSFSLTEDGLTLLEIKSTLNDTKNVLSNWSPTDETPCKWTGISCHPEDSRVSSVALHQNGLHGYIPNELANCSELRALYLRANYLQGGIPSNIGNLSYLTILDLSCNSFKGSIPSSIGRLTHLRNLFFGNQGLCGRQVNKPCRTSLGFPVVLPHAEIPPKRSSHYTKGLLIGAISTAGFVLVILIVFTWTRLVSKKERTAKSYMEVKKQKSRDTSAKLITFHGDLLYPTCEIIEKLEALNETNVVGSGGLGTVYRMVMNDSGAFAVKKIDRTQDGPDQVVERELEILGSIKHINLVKLRERGPEQSLDWSARLNIALGSARGLAYLHHDCCPKIVHCNIKSSNILLDENLEPHVSDFGLAKLSVDGDSHVTTVVAGTFGYLAPEYLESGIGTEKSDVYSFGVLLLELVTGKRPSDPFFSKRGVNIVGWLNTLRGEDQLENIVDNRCKNADVETVEAILEIAARCTNGNPTMRPTMNQVLQQLEQEVMSPYPSDYSESHSDYS
uniref:Protein kinase domain-containing protein n=1 Tax=Cucumis melo TaxID=3656 RepID=A0A9I9DF79_CUCME